MLEISIFCVILFAIAYWATLFIMGRREDVLHGEFVEPQPELAETALPASAPAPIFPPKPMIARKPAPPRSAPAAVTAPALPPAVTTEPDKPANSEALQSLMASLKQELKNAAQI
jgi:hypothetical protein